VCDEARKGQKPFTEIEKQLNSGVDHQMLGMGLAEMWKFPRSCQLVAGYHHQPSALAGDHRTLVRLVHIADVLCCQSGKGFNLTAVAQPIAPDALAEMKLDAVTVEKVRGQIETWLTTGANLFG
jgi:hypothetical protein